ncbi:MAG: YqiA/YcfP family alpha/beta fold hydrolase [Burkholderiales bacterium]
MLVYIHGFNSSPASHKARQLRERLAAIGREADFVCPALPHLPREAMALLEKTVAQADAARTTLVGSSLGGFYATWLTERTGCRAVLVNPAITPHEGLRAYLGPQKNLYTHEAYTFTEEHLAQLAEFYIERPAHLDRYLLIHTTGDELLDWRIAVDRYHGCRQIVVKGSDHGFAEFGAYIEPVLEFANARV